MDKTWDLFALKESVQSPEAEEVANLNAMKTAKDASFTQDKFDDVLMRAVQVHNQVMYLIHKKHKALEPVPQHAAAANLNNIPLP